MSTEESLATWFSFTLPWDDSSKTAVDASDLLLKSNEAVENLADLIDSRGFVQTDSNGHFTFSNTSQRVRFWGINLNFSAVYPPSPDHPATSGNEFPDDQVAEKLAARLAKLGFNAVRLHHLDNWNRPSGIWLEPWSNTQRLDPVQLARLDYLIYQLKEHGIYVDLNLHVSRNFVLGDGVTDADLMKDSNVSYNKSTTLFDPIAIGLQQQYAQTILTHINPYTELAYANDPVIFTTETTNEDSFPWTFLYDNLNHDPTDNRKLPKFYSQQLDGWAELGGVDTSLNRLGNAGFEDGLDDHWFTQTSSPAEADFVTDTTNPYVDAAALRVDVNQVTGTDWHVQFGQTNLALQAGKRYRLHFAVRADTARTISGAVMRHVTPYNSLGWSDSVGVTTAWQTHTIEFEATETLYGDARISFNVGAESGSIWFDDFQFQEIDPFNGWLGWLEQKYGSTAALSTAWAPTGGLAGTEMLIDGGFESGFSSWGTQASTGNEASWATDTNEMTEGTQSLQVAVTQADGSNWHIQFWQAGLSVIKDQAYRLTYDLKSNVDGQMSLNIMQHHSPWSQLGWATTVDVSMTWQQYEHIFTPNQDDTNARLTLQVGHSGPRTIWMDNVSLKPVVREGLLGGESLEANNVARLRYSDRAGYSEQRFRDTVQFYEETQRAYFQQMQTFIQSEVGSQSLNTGTATLGLPDVRAMADLDFVDTHYYWDHPWWPNGPAWQPTGWVIKNRSWLNSPFAGFFDMAAGAVQGKPFTVTEFNSASPNRYAVEAPLLMALMGNLQDWDGLFLFAYAHSQSDFDDDAISSYFDLAGNPVATGVMPVAARLFLGEQTSAAPTVSELHLTADERYGSMARGGSIESFLKNDKAFDPAVVFGGRVRIADLDAATPQTHNLPVPTGPVYQSAGNQLTWDTSTADRSLFTFDAPQAQGVIGFMDDQRVSLTDVTFDIPAQTADFGAITLQSQDDRTLATSREMLLGVFTRAENTGMIWNAAQNSVDDQWGSAPTLIQPFTFDATLNAANSADVEVWTLDETGAERSQIVHQIVGPSQISFTVDTATDKTLWYRIISSPDLSPTLSVTTTSSISGTFVHYSNTSDIYANPERGFYKHTETHSASYTPLTLSTLQGYYADNQTLILRIFYLEDFVDSDISQDYLNKIQVDFDTVRDAGLKAVARVAYTNVYTTTPPYGDATKAQVLSHIAQLAPLLQANADVIATVQAGFIGSWGEWHFTDHFAADPTNPGNVTAADYADRREIVDALLNVLPPTIQVQIRTPEDKQNMFGDGSTGAGAALSATEAHNGSYIARAAHHNDCFLASDTDYGTYGNINDDKAYLELETRYLVMGGETCNPNPPRSTCATALAELERFHWTYLNTDYHPGVLSSWVADGCMAEVEQRLGYRLALQQGLYSDTVRPGDGFTFNIALQNLGFAAPIKARPVKLLLRHTTSGDLYQVTLPADSRDWLPTGDSHILDHTVCTPADMPLGDYAMLLHLPDRAEALAAQPAYAIQLANNGVWESDTGYNNLFHTIRLDNSAPAAACDDTLNLKKVVENPLLTPGWDDGVQWLKNQQVPNSIVPTSFSGREGAVISYRVPEDSSSYSNLYDRSWLYSNSLAAVTWALENECSNAQNTLAVLASLVEADGKLGFSFSTQSVFVHELYRSGAIAWAGYAFTLYQDQCLDSQFEATARSIADWLLTQQDGTSSVQGGPDVTWHSTEHNIDAYFFFRDLGLLTSNGSYKQAATEIKTSLLTNHWNDSYACFQQGIGDPEKALDVASWGAIFLKSIGETEKASSCLAFLELNYPVTHTCTFQNEDRSVAGYLPYGDNAGINQVDLVWSEGTLGVALAYQRLGNIAQRDAILTNMLKMQGADGGIAYSCPPIPEKEWQEWESVAGTAWLTMVASENQAEFWRTDPPTSTLFYISSSTGGRVQGVRFHDEDILVVDVDSGTVEKIFDGSDVGVRVDLNAFHVMDDGTILMSFNRPATINGLAVDDSDIVRFTSTKLGADTAGSFALYFDGSDVGLTSRGEDIDAITLDADGRLIISTLGSFRRNPSDTGSTLNGKDEDLFVFNHSSLGMDTAGTWSHYFDGSDLGLTTSTEDVWGVAIDPDNNDLVLTVKGAFAVTGGLAGDGADLFNCTSAQLGDTTACSLSMRWDGSEDGFGGERVDSFAFSNGIPLSISAATRNESIGEDDVDELLDDDVDDEALYMPLIINQ